MPVKTTDIKRWEVMLEVDATDASTVAIAVNSIDGDEGHVKVRLGTIERIISVEDWLALANAVNGRIKHAATR